MSVDYLPTQQVLYEYKLLLNKVCHYIKSTQLIAVKMA